MRKRYVEKLSFYKLLDELNALPEECSTSPYYFQKILGDKLQYIDYYVTFTRHIQDVDDPFQSTLDNKFTLLFMYKSCNVRICGNARFSYEIECTEDILREYVFCSQILTVSDFITYHLLEHPVNGLSFRKALQIAQSFDNEKFNSINP